MDIEGIECVSKVLVLISSSLALLGILFKGANEFFLNTIRMRYETIPGQKSVFRTVITMVIGLISAIEVLFMVLSVSVIKDIEFDPSYQVINNIGENKFAALYMGAFLYAYIINVIIFFDIRKYYIDMFEGKRKWNVKKRCTNILISSMVANIVSIAISTFIILFNGFNKSVNLTYGQLSIFIGIDILSIVGFCISYSLMQVIEIINDKKKYTFIMANKNMSCRLYLDIGEYYLIFKKGKETYIRKTEVKEIIYANDKSAIDKDKKQCADKVEEQKM